MIEIFSYEFMQRAFIASIIISICTGLLSPYIVLRRLSLIGDGLAHLAFAGIAIAFLFNTPPILTALIVALLGSLLIRKLIEKNVYGEAAIALILSFGVGLGIIIIGATKGFGVDLFSYLIGSILAVRWIDITLLGILLFAIIAFLYIFKRELFLLTFQQDIARLSSKKTIYADYLFSILIAIVTVMAIQAVGILLVSALLVIPALISLRLANSFRQTIIISIIVSAISSIIGISGSFYADIPPSGFIVMLLLGMYVLTLVKKS